jgi:hypothetical protein
MLEVYGRWLRARVHPDGSRVEALAVLGLDLEPVARKGEPMSDNVIGCFAVAFRPRCPCRPLAVSSRRPPSAAQRPERARSRGSTSTSPGSAGASYSPRSTRGGSLRPVWFSGRVDSPPHSTPSHPLASSSKYRSRPGWPQRAHPHSHGQSARSPACCSRLGAPELAE